MLNNKEFSFRLKKIIDFNALSASSFADKINVPRSSISHILSGRNKPSLDFVLKVTDTFKEVDLYWLLNGIGNFPSTDSSPTPTSPPKNLSEKKTLKEKPTEEEKITESNNITEIESVLIFYKDGTFKEFKNRG